MKERPILFSGEMVKAILRGAKTQTRRVVKPFPYHGDWGNWAKRGEFKRPCPYGQPGDLLWVREPWRFLGVDMNRLGRTHWAEDVVVEYRDETRRTIEVDWKIGEAELLRHNRWRPSIHMPRWASRLTLNIMDVHVQRVQGITDGDVAAEGVDWASTRIGNDHGSPARDAFIFLWDKINGKRAPWSNNPWVWAISFVATKKGILDE